MLAQVLLAQQVLEGHQQGQVIQIVEAVETQVAEVLEAEVLETVQACRVLLAVVVRAAQEAQAHLGQVMETIKMEIIKGGIVCQIMKIKII